MCVPHFSNTACAVKLPYVGECPSAIASAFTLSTSLGGLGFSFGFRLACSCQLSAACWLLRYYRSLG